MTEHENWYWEVEDFGDALVGKLHFTEFYDDEIILSWKLNKDCDDEYNYNSTLLGVEQDIYFADTPDEAMEEFIDMIESHIEEEISRLEEQLEKFRELK